MQTAEETVLLFNDHTPYTNVDGEEQRSIEIAGITMDVTDDETKIEEHDTNYYDQQLNDIMNNLFYIYYEHMITGPFEAKDILKLYITSKIKDEIWIKKAYNLKTSKWHKFKLSSKRDAANKSFKNEFPQLHNYLISMMRAANTNSTRQIVHEAPLDAPQEAKKEMPFVKKLFKWIGYALLFLAILVVGLHMIPIALPAFIPIMLCAYVCPCSGTSEKKFVQRVLRIISSAGFLVIPFIVVYFLLLDEFFDEMQSWMIGYIVWGICSFLLILPVTVVDSCIREECEYYFFGQDFLDFLLAAEFSILGVHFGSISLRDLRKNSDSLFYIILFIFPTIVALLPSFIIGFIANFALEEKFELECNDDVDGDAENNICYNDGSGCCRVISSHDIWNTYTFIGGLASNILATWAIVRICGYFMVHVSDQAAMFAKRKR